MKIVTKTTILFAAFAWASMSYGITFDLTEGETLPRSFGVRGNTESTQGWAPFEGQVGSMSVLDDKGVVLVESPMNVEGEWMKEGPHDFVAFADFKTKASSGIVRFNNNAIGDKDMPLSIEYKVLFETDGVKVELAPETEVGGITKPNITVEPIFSEEVSKTWWQSLIDLIMFWK